MKKQLTILLLFLLQNIVTITIYAQGGTWTWISGTSNANAAGVYGAVSYTHLDVYKRQR